MSCGDKSDTVATEPSITDAVETTATITTTVPDTVAPAITTTTTAATTTTVAPEPGSSTVWSIPDGIEVAVAGPDGLHVLTGSDDRIISPVVFANVVADPTGDGWLVQEEISFADAAMPGSIRRVDDDGTDEVLLTADEGTFLQMHDAAVVEGHTTLFVGVDLIRDVPNFEVLDELYAFDLVTGERTKITDVGGWEAGVNLTYGGGVLAGIWSSEATVEPWSVDLTGHLEVVDFEQAGLEARYADVPEAPTSLAISADGSRLAWIARNVTDEFDYLNQQLVVVNTDGSDRHEFTLPNGPTSPYDLVDRGQFVVAGGGLRAGALIDVETGGILWLPVVGPAAATGKWDESPRWPIASSATEDVTEQIRALEPQWATATPYDKALAQALLGDDGGGECASIVRSFPSTGDGDATFYIELRQFCDDSVTGEFYEVTVVDPQPGGSRTGSATRRTLCSRGVTADGLCV